LNACKNSFQFDIQQKLYTLLWSTIKRLNLYDKTKLCHCQVVGILILINPVQYTTKRFTVKHVNNLFCKDLLVLTNPTFLLINKSAKSEFLVQYCNTKNFVWSSITNSNGFRLHYQFWWCIIVVYESFIFTRL